MSLGQAFYLAVLLCLLRMIPSQTSAADVGQDERVYPNTAGCNLTQRLLYYALILFPVGSKKAAWLITGAPGTVTTVAALAALYAVFLAGMSNHLF
ncbi:hypothetical protein BJX64DRAFT_256853 [Aspergillus heterothallicus]